MDDAMRKRYEALDDYGKHLVHEIGQLVLDAVEETRETVEAEFRKFADLEFDGIRDDAYLRRAYKPYACGLVHEMWKRNAKTEGRDAEWEQVVRNLREELRAQGPTGIAVAGACDEILKRMGRRKEGA